MWTWAWAWSRARVEGMGEGVGKGRGQVSAWVLMLPRVLMDVGKGLAGDVGVG